jgi:hypothetical protein
MKYRVSAMVAGLAAASCLAAVAVSAGEVERSEKASQQLANALQGRTAGAPVNCIPNYQGKSRMEVIDDSTILFRDHGTVYVQVPRGKCHGLESGGVTLITRQYGSTQLCSGDINEMIQPTTGIGFGSCVYGPFVPYRKTG